MAVGEVLAGSVFNHALHHCPDLLQGLTGTNMAVQHFGLEFPDHLAMGAHLFNKNGLNLFSVIGDCVVKCKNLKGSHSHLVSD